MRGGSIDRNNSHFSLSYDFFRDQEHFNTRFIEADFEREGQLEPQRRRGHPCDFSGPPSVGLDLAATFLASITQC